MLFEEKESMEDPGSQSILLQAILLFVLTFNYFYKNIDISFADVLRRITFTQNFYSLDENYYKKFPEGWSLAVEEWFYLLFPLLIFIVHRVTKKSYLPTYIYRLSLIILLVFSSFRFYDELILGNLSNLI